MRIRAAAPIDPLGDVVDGRYEDDLVVVTRRGDAWPHPARGRVRTPHFEVVTHDHRLVVTHDVRPQDIDDRLAGVIVDELFTPGWVHGSEMFERILTGVVRAGDRSALESWELFYRNTIRHLSPVHDRAVGLVRPGPVLELGSRFGVLALRLATAGHPTTASDVSAGAVRLLAVMAPRLGAELDTLLADPARVPVGDGFADTVVVVHLLEHLEPGHGAAVVAEAVRCARRRVVIAVSLQPESDEFSGRARPLTLDDLRRWGRSSRLPHEVTEDHGGWLVLDRD